MSDYEMNDKPSRHRCEFLDLAAGILPVIESNLGRSFEQQIEAWQEFYATNLPSLPQRLYNEYSEFEGGWMAIAREYVWPHLGERMECMKTANASIRKVYADVYNLVEGKLGFSEPLVIMSYVGIGNGAGWATQWDGRLAVLCGLENIAELGWQDEKSIRGLLFHEIGHLYMMSLRGIKETERLAEDPLLVLYEEGFAQHCEHVVMGEETWHCSSQEGWREWCKDHEGYLAGKYLEALDSKEDWRKFFGSWFDVDGWRQTGYFMGCRLVQRMAESMSLQEVAVLSEDEIRRFTEEYLHSYQ